MYNDASLLQRENVIRSFGQQQIKTLMYEPASTPRSLLDGIDVMHHERLTHALCLCMLSFLQ